MNRLDISCRWLGHGTNATPEQAALADLTIRANGSVLTESEDLFAMTIQEGARLSAYHLALWVASNWWRLRWEPWRDTADWKMSHCIAAAGGGYAWPDICFASDGSLVLMTARPLHSKEMPVRYLCASMESISASEFEAGLTDFIERVLGRIESFTRDKDVLRTLWQDVQEERQHPQQTAWRKLEALMGYDPDEVDETLMNELQVLSQVYGIGSIEELAAYGAKQTPRVVEELVARAGKTEKINIHKWDVIKKEMTNRNNAPPWQQAQEAAAAVRGAWGLSATSPISNEALADLLSIRPESIESGEALKLPGLGVTSGSEKNTFALLLSKRLNTGRRFELARLVGDSLNADPADRLLPATQLKTARQKFQRAFAQEMLCPYNALLAFLGGGAIDDEAIEEAAITYHVSPLLVKTTLVNHGLLQREELGI